METMFKSHSVARALAAAGTTISLGEFVRRLEERAATHRDHTLAAKELRFNNGWLQLGVTEPMPMTRAGATRLLERVGMPRGVNDWLLDHDRRKWREITSKLFTTWQEQNADRGWLVRTALDDAGRRRVRGVLSDQYRILDDIDAGRALDVSLRLAGHEDAQILVPHGEVSFVGIEGLSARVVLPSMETANGSNFRQTVAMLFYRNNELGEGSLVLQAGCFRLICTNGLVAGSIDAISRMRHIGNLHVDMPTIVRGVIESSAALGQKLLALNDIGLEHPADTLVNLAPQVGLGKRLARDVAANMVATPESGHEGRSTAYMVVNNLTLAAQSRSGDTRLEMERAAGRMVTLSPKHWAAADTVLIG